MTPRAKVTTIDQPVSQPAFTGDSSLAHRSYNRSQGGHHRALSKNTNLHMLSCVSVCVCMGSRLGQPKLTASTTATQPASQHTRSHRDGRHRDPEAVAVESRRQRERERKRDELVRVKSGVCVGADAYVKRVCL